MGVWPNTSRLPFLDGEVYMATITQDGKGLTDEKPKACTLPVLLYHSMST